MRVSKRMRTILKANPATLASPADPQSLSQLPCGVWANWQPLMQRRYVAGVAHGMRWWMLWEGCDARKTKTAWGQVRDDITTAHILRELHKYCAANPHDNFLNALAATMWKVARDKGVSIREW